MFVGQILTAAQGQNPARQSAMLAGIPKEVPSTSVNMLCGSGRERERERERERDLLSLLVLVTREYLTENYKVIFVRFTYSCYGFSKYSMWRC